MRAVSPGDEELVTLPRHDRFLARYVTEQRATFWDDFGRDAL
jgi:hypothetical protein